MRLAPIDLKTGEEVLVNTGKINTVRYIARRQGEIVKSREILMRARGATHGATINNVIYYHHRHHHYYIALVSHYMLLLGSKKARQTRYIIR